MTEEQVVRIWGADTWLEIVEICNDDLDESEKQTIINRARCRLER